MSTSKVKRFGDKVRKVMLRGFGRVEQGPWRKDDDDGAER